VQYPDYDPQLASAALEDSELDALDAQLQALPSERAMNIEALDGFLTALAVGPWRAFPRSAAWMPLVWGGDGAGAAPFTSEKQRKRTALLVLRHLHAIDAALRTAPERWEPVVSVAETDERELVDAEDWCAGFLEAVALDPEVWAPAFEEPLLAPIARLGAEDGEPPADEAELDALSRAAIDAVQTLAEQRPKSA
jgi:uncharacterized protein